MKGGSREGKKKMKGASSRVSPGPGDARPPDPRPKPRGSFPAWLRGPLLPDLQAFLRGEVPPTPRLENINF